MTIFAAHPSCNGHPRNVRDLKPGQRARISGVKSFGAIRQRLLDMGIIPDVIVEVARVAPAGDPVWIKLRESQLALRREEAEAVLVAPC